MSIIISIFFYSSLQKIVCFYYVQISGLAYFSALCCNHLHIFIANNYESLYKVAASYLGSKLALEQHHPVMLLFFFML